MVMPGTFRGQSLGPWVLCDPPSSKTTDLQGIVVSPVKVLSEQDKLVHAALVLSLSCYCGHVNGHFHHNCRTVQQGPAFSILMCPPLRRLCPPSMIPFSLSQSLWSFSCALHFFSLSGNNRGQQIQLMRS